MRPRLLDLPGGHQTQLDEVDFENVVQSGLTVYLGSNGYAYFSRWESGRSWPGTLHRWLMEAPKGAHVDHINGDKLDNRRQNLRIVSPQTNQVNRKQLNKNNSSGIRGVQHVPHLSSHNPWRAQITVERKNIHLGLFATRPKAVAARREAERQHYGEECP